VRVVVTGGAGKAGRAVVRELVDHGHRVRNVDLRPQGEAAGEPYQADLTDLGQTYEVLRRQEAVVHLAAIPRPYLLTDEQTFRINVLSAYNVFAAAAHLGLQRVVWASSETVLGLPFDSSVPSFPVDEEQPPAPKSTYALSKVVGEDLARYFAAKAGIPYIGLRFSNIYDEADYGAVASFQDDPRARSWNAWGWVDARDVAQACRRALEADVGGAEVFIIAAADTVMATPNDRLLAEVFPGVPVRGALGPYETLLSIGKARRVLGYDPRYSMDAYVPRSG